MSSLKQHLKFMYNIIHQGKHLPEFSTESITLLQTTEITLLFWLLKRRFDIVTRCLNIFIPEEVTKAPTEIVFRSR